jgi:hypothetical protein
MTQLQRETDEFTDLDSTLILPVPDRQYVGLTTNAVRRGPALFMSWRRQAERLQKEAQDFYFVFKTSPRASVRKAGCSVYRGLPVQSHSTHPELHSGYRPRVSLGLLPACGSLQIPAGKEIATHETEHDDDSSAISPSG